MDGSPDIILLTLDSLRADYCSCFGGKAETPSIDSIAEEGILYTNTRSTASWTVPSISSLFTGQLPSTVGAYANSERFEIPREETLAGRLKSSGYQTFGVSANPWLSEEFGFDSGFDELRRVRNEVPFPAADYPPVRDWADTWRRKAREIARWISRSPMKRGANLFAHYQSEGPYANADAVNDELVKFLRLESPKFIFANYMDVHEPYHDQGGSKSAIEYPLEVDWNLHSLVTPPRTDPETIREAYRESVEYLDEIVGEFLEALKKNNLFDNSLIIIASDHGQALGEHGFWGHGTFLHESLLHVPLIVKPPSSWDIQSVPKNIDTNISLKWVYDLVCRVSQNEGSKRTILQPERQENHPVIAESHGSPQDIALSLPGDQSKLARSFIFEEIKTIHLDNPSRELLFAEGEKPTDRLNTVIQTSRKISSELPPLGTEDKNNIKKPEGRTEQQLKNLGYL